MEIWIPLIAACIGGLIATIPVLIGLVVQIYLHISDNRRKDREAKTQLTLERRTSEIKVIEDSIDSSLISMNILDTMRAKSGYASFSDDKMRLEFTSAYHESISKYRLGELAPLADKLASSLGDKILSEYHGFNRLCVEYIHYLLSSDYAEEKQQELYTKIITRAGKLHSMLQEKLISIRDT